MGSTVNPRARGGASLREELRAGRKDREQDRRLKVRSDAPPVLVQVSDEENLSWPVGTAWLDTSGEV
jgi:hypothetical protein